MESFANYFNQPTQCPSSIGKIDITLTTPNINGHPNAVFSILGVEIPEGWSGGPVYDWYTTGTDGHIAATDLVGFGLGPSSIDGNPSTLYVEESYSDGTVTPNAGNNNYVLILPSYGDECSYQSSSSGTWSGAYTTSSPKAIGYPSTPIQPNELPNSPANPTTPNQNSCPGNSSDPEPNAICGNPINAATGNKFEIETDFTGAPNTGLSLVRYYNSLDTGGSAYGSNWRTAWHRGLTLSSTAVIVTRSDGRQDTFTNNNGVYSADPDVTSVLTATTNNGVITGYKLTTANDSIETYSATGRLLSVASRDGLATTLSYNSSNQLATVTGPFGSVMSFAYDTSGRVVQMTAPDGGTYAYAYDANSNLMSVTYPDKTVRTYLYENVAFPHALTGITDENGNRFATWTYDSHGTAISSQHAGGAELTTVTYNSDGSSTVTDANGNAHTYGFTTLFNITKPVGLTGAPIQALGGKAFSYDANGFIASKTDYDGNVTTYSHDARGNQISRTEASSTSLARTTTTAWHPQFHLPVIITEPNGRTTTYAYDAKGNILNKTIAFGSQIRSWNYTYNASSQVLTAKDPLGNVTAYTYDAHGNIATTTNALGQTTSFTSYDGAGRLLSAKDPNGLISTLGYDVRGRITSLVAGTETTVYAYDKAGNLTKVTRPDGSMLSYSYDAAHRLTTVTDGIGNQIAYSLDANSNQTAVKVYDPTKALLRSRTQAFDAVNRLVQSIGAQGQTTAFAYDANGNPTNVTDPLNNQTTLAYDSLNRLISSIDPNGNTTQTNHDSADNLLAVTDPLNHVTNYSYDGLGNRLTTTSPDTKQSQNSYDAAGNLISSVDALGQTVSYTYDALNRRTQTLFANKPPIVFSYDQGINGIGHLTQMSDGTDTTQWAYDLHGRVTSKTFFSGSLTLVTKYAYAANGQLATITYPSGKLVKLSYSSNGQIIELDNNTTPLLSAIQYQPFGLAKSWTFGNGVKTSRSFDLDGRITGYDLGGNRTRQLAYDAASRITSYNDTNLNYDQNFTYDNLARLTQYSDPNTQISYSYDPNGNRTQLATTGTASQNYTLDANSNRLLGVTSNNQPVKTYSYDADGHITSDGYTTFTYDGRGRLVKASNLAIGSEQYRINGLGQRDAKVTGNPPDMSGDANQDGTINATDLRLIVLMASGSIPVNMAADCNHDGKITTVDATCAQAKLADMHLNPGKYVQTGTYFVYDGAGHLLGEYTQSGAAIQETVWLGNTPVAVLSGSNSYYVYADHLNAPRAIADNTGTVVWRWDSEAFGTTLANSDPDGNGVAFTYNLRFPGQYYDKSTGLHYNWNRDYNPAIGRYIESDPIGLGGGLNAYTYVEGNPVISGDSNGLCSDLRRCMDNFLRSRGGDLYVDYVQTFSAFRWADDWKKTLKEAAGVKTVAGGIGSGAVAVGGTIINKADSLTGIYYGWKLQVIGKTFLKTAGAVATGLTVGGTYADILAYIACDNTFDAINPVDTVNSLNNQIGQGQLPQNINTFGFPTH